MHNGDDSGDRAIVDVYDDDFACLYLLDELTQPGFQLSNVSFHGEGTFSVCSLNGTGRLVV